jgi:hypothetical protein
MSLKFYAAKGKPKPEWSPAICANPMHRKSVSLQAVSGHRENCVWICEQDNAQKQVQTGRQMAIAPAYLCRLLPFSMQHGWVSFRTRDPRSAEGQSSGHVVRISRICLLRPEYAPTRSWQGSVSLPHNAQTCRWRGWRGASVEMRHRTCKRNTGTSAGSTVGLGMPVATGMAERGRRVPPPGDWRNVEPVCGFQFHVARSVSGGRWSGRSADSVHQHSRRGAGPDHGCRSQRSFGTKPSAAVVRDCVSLLRWWGRRGGHGIIPSGWLTIRSEAGPRHIGGSDVRRQRDLKRTSQI